MTLRRRSEQRENAAVEYEKLENGEHEGRLVYVADLGLQTREFKGEVKSPAQQLSLGIEILGKPVTIDGEEKPRVLWTKPFYVYHEMSDKGWEFRHFKVFDTKAQPETVADWDSVLGTPCNVVVTKHVSGDKEYDNIEAITPIPAKYQDAIEPSELVPCIGDADDPSNPCTMALFGLPKWVFDKRVEGDDAQF